MSVVTTQTINLKVMCNVFTSESNQLQTRGEESSGAIKPKPRQDKVVLGEHESAGMYNVCMTGQVCHVLVSLCLATKNFKG